MPRTVKRFWQRWLQGRKNKHPNDRDLLEALQDFRRLCRDYYTKDGTVYLAFQNVMRQKQMQPQPQYQPQPQLQYQAQPQPQPQYQAQPQPQSQSFNHVSMPKWFGSQDNAMGRAFQWILRNLGALFAVFFIFFLVSTLITGGLLSFVFTLAFACVAAYFLQKVIRKNRGVNGNDGWYNSLYDNMSRAGQWIWQNFVNLIKGLLNRVFR